MKFNESESESTEGVTVAHAKDIGVVSEIESETVMINESESESSEGATVAHTNDISIVSVKVKVTP